jgi:ribosomal protein S18 acetylase RimI-like enzyme
MPLYPAVARTFRRRRPTRYTGRVEQTPAVDPMQILALEELSLNAWPAAYTLPYDGWLLRLTDGYTRRANSVQPLYPSSLDLSIKIAYCERIYRAHGLTTIFKVTSAPQHSDLDARLAALGYSQEGKTTVQTLQLAKIAKAEGAWADTADLSCDDRLTERWLEAYTRWSDLDLRHVPAMRRLLSGIVPAHRFVAIHDQGTIIALALVVLERRYAGIFDLVVGAPYRRQGIGTHLVRHVLHWARLHDADHAYLQVVEDNAPARRLYATLGFRDAYTYWYRVNRTTIAASRY